MTRKAVIQKPQVVGVQFQIDERDLELVDKSVVGEVSIRRERER